MKSKTKKNKKIILLVDDNPDLLYSVKKGLESISKDFEIVTMKNGRPAAKASVTIDGETHKMFRILSKEDAKKYS